MPLQIPLSGLLSPEIVIACMSIYVNTGSSLDIALLNKGQMKREYRPEYDNLKALNGLYIQFLITII